MNAKVYSTNFIVTNIVTITRKKRALAYELAHAGRHLGNTHAG
jgi:hypothetical protein